MGKPSGGSSGWLEASGKNDSVIAKTQDLFNQLGAKAGGSITVQAPAVAPASAGSWTSHIVPSVLGLFGLLLVMKALKDK